MAIVDPRERDHDGPTKRIQGGCALEIIRSPPGLATRKCTYPAFPGLLTSHANKLIISGDGIKELIPIVLDLVDAAPAMEGWKIIAFRPRMDGYASFTLDFGERHLDPKKIWCWSRVEDGSFDLVIYHADYSDEIRDLLVNGTYILLDMALGEYDVMTGIRYIDHRELPDDPETLGLYRFEDLRSVFDEHKSTITH